MEEEEEVDQRVDGWIEGGVSLSRRHPDVPVHVTRHTVGHGRSFVGKMSRSE